MNKGYRLSITILVILIFSLSPLIYIAQAIPVDPVDKWSLAFGVDAKSIIPKATIVSVNGEDYIMLAPNLLYPVKDIPSESLPDGRVIRILSRDVLKKLMLRFIIEYKDSSQLKTLVNLIDKWGGKILYKFKYLPFISVELPLENASLPIVLGLNVEVSVDHKVHVYLNESVPMIKDPVLWSKLEAKYGYPIDGRGVIIAVLDTGIDGRHPDFYFKNGTCKIVINVSMVPDEPAIDYFGHGTHVAGIAAGTGLASGGKFVGVAPGALLANIKVLNKEGMGYDSWIIAGIEYAVEHGVDVINLSLGGGMNGDGSDPLSEAVDWAVEHNVVVVAAAGNDGPHYSTLGSPGVAKLAITVGAVDKNYKIPDFSSRGPTGDGRPKPEVVAPGVNIIAPLARNSTIEKIYSEYIIHGHGGDYVPLSGTSMATPHVAGLAALVRQAHPDWNAIMIRNVIISTADPLGYDVYTEGAGIVNAYDAVTSIVYLNETIGTVMLGKLYKSPTSISIELSSLDKISHAITGLTLKSKEFYNESTDIDGYLTITYPSTISPGASNIMKLEVSKSIPYGIYFGRCEIIIDGIYKYEILFTVSRTLVIEVNATYGGEYFDTLFMIYNVKYPDRWVLPHGFKWSYNNETGEYNYTEWFYVLPGKYKLYGISLNIFMGEDTIPGPIFIYSENLTVYGDRFLKLEFTRYKSINLPYQYDGKFLTPVANVFSFYTKSYKSLVVYQFGIWNLSNYKLYISHTTGEPIYLSSQYVSLPDRLLWINPYKGIDYSTTLIVSSWIIRKTPTALSLGMLTKYRFDTASTRSGVNAYSGFAVFPPTIQYTYVVLLPFYQGVDYTVYSDNLKPLIPANNSKYEYRYFVGLSQNVTTSSITILDPEYTAKNINPTKPPFYMYTRVMKGSRGNSPYINVTSLLVSNLDPPILRGFYKFNYKLYRNNILCNSSKDAGILSAPFRYVPDPGGVYKYIMEARGRWPFFNKIKTILIFDTSAGDYEPPIIYSLNYNPFISGDNVKGGITILDRSDITQFKITGIWDDKLSIDADIKLVRKTRAGIYNMYIYEFNIPVLGYSLALNISVVDSQGNKHLDYYGSAASKYIPTLETTFNVTPRPKFLNPGVNSTILVSPSDNYLYGFKMFINGTYVGALYTVNDPEDSGLVLSPETYGVYNISLTSRPILTSNEVTLSTSIIATKLKVLEYYPKINRVGVGSEVRAGIKIVYDYKNIPAKGAYAVINGSLYQADEHGIIKFLVSRNNVGIISFKIDGIYTASPESNVTIYEAPYDVYKIIFDRVLLNIDKTTLRVDVSSPAIIKIDAYYEYDHTPFKGRVVFKYSGPEFEGEVKAEGSGEFIVNLDSPGKVCKVDVYPSSIEDYVYNVSIFKPSFKSISIIFDKVIIHLTTDAPHIVSVGSVINISYEAYYAYDHSKFEGVVNIEPYPYTSNEAGLVTFRVSSIEDKLYGIKTFDANEINIFFDNLKVDIDTAVSLGVYEYNIKISYVSSGEPAEAIVTIDGHEYKAVGQFNYKVDSLLPTQTINLKIHVEGFPEYSRSISIFNYYNLMLYIAIIILIAAVGIYIKRR